jgi:hypothetical protein
MKVTKEFREKIKGGEKRYSLSKELGVSQTTLQRWLDVEKYDYLTTINRIKVLERFTGLTQKQIFEEEAY